jgi:hypothetical protein
MNIGLKRMFQFCLLLFLVGLGGMAWLFVQGNPFHTAMTQVEDERTIAGTVKALQISTSRVDVVVSASHSNQASVRLSGMVPESRQQEVTLHSELAPDGTLQVEVKELQGATGFWHDDTHLQLEVLLPETADGYGSIRIDTATGDIRTDSLSAKQASIRTETGDVALGGFIGEALELSTETGDIDLKNVTGALRAQSTTGDVDVHHVPELLHDIWIVTDTGDVRLSVAKQPQSANLRLVSHTGDVSLEWPQTTVRDAGPSLTVETTTGDIWIQ